MKNGHIVRTKNETNKNRKNYPLEENPWNHLKIKYCYYLCFSLILPRCPPPTILLTHSFVFLFQ